VLAGSAFDRAEELATVGAEVELLRREERRVGERHHDAVRRRPNGVRSLLRALAERLVEGLGERLAASRDRGALRLALLGGVLELAAVALRFLELTLSIERGALRLFRLGRELLVLFDQRAVRLPQRHVVREQERDPREAEDEEPQRGPT